MSGLQRGSCKPITSNAGELRVTPAKEVFLETQRRTSDSTRFGLLFKASHVAVETFVALLVSRCFKFSTCNLKLYMKFQA